MLSEFNVIHSVLACKAQVSHWDFDPDHVKYDGTRLLQRKPRSAMLSLQPGTRLFVYGPVLGHDVTAVVPPCAILLFDGDVAHAGASYAGGNTKVHLYLDVAGVVREQNVTWFER